MRRIASTTLVLGIVLTLVTPVLASYSANGRSFSQSVVIREEEEDFDVFYAVLGLLDREPETIIPNWDKASDKQKQDFEDGINFYFDEVLKVYNEPGYRINPYKEIVTNYYAWIDLIEINVLEPIVIDGEIIKYTVPDLKRQIYTYMPIRTITSTNSYQYKFKPYIAPDEEGYMRYGEAYSIALGQYYGTKIGTIYEITFSDSRVIQGVLTDCKRTTDTDSTHRYADGSQVYDGSVGNVVEFVFDDTVQGLGELSLATRMNTINKRIATEFPNPVVSIKRVGVVDAMLQMYRAYDEW